MSPNLFLINKYSIIIVLLLISCFSNIGTSIPTDIDENCWIYPELQSDEIFAAPTLDFTKFWNIFKSYTYWSLEDWNPVIEKWEFCNDILIVDVTNVGDDSRKLNLIFNAPAAITTDYRISLIIDNVKEYYQIDDYAYNLSFDIYNENINVIYDFSDISHIPGIAITHNIKNDCFLFDVICNDVISGDHIELDPTYTVYTGVNVRGGFGMQRKLVRESDGTLWCTFDENYDIHVAYSEDDGVTWNDYEVCGGAPTHRYSSIAIDSNNVVHLVFQSYKNDFNDYQLEYSNSTDWTTIVQIRDEDKHHQFPAIAVDSNDNLHIVYMKGEEGASNDYQVGYINSTDNGGSWGTEKILTNEPDVGDAAGYPAIAIDSNDNISVIFTCTNHYLGFDDVLHMQSSDYGDTWTDWESDPIYQDAAHDQFTGCIAIDDNDTKHSVWYGTNQNVTTQIGYSYNDSTGWKSVEWITWDPSLGYWYSTISVNANDYIHTAYDASGTRLNHSINNTVSWTEDIALAGDYNTPNMISTQWPVIGGIKTNRPETGYAFICTFTDTKIIYHASADLTWKNNPPTQSNHIIWNTYMRIEKILNATNVYLYPTSFNVTINDLDGDDMIITVMSNESGAWIILKSGNNLLDGTYSFYNISSWVDNYNTKYWISFNVTDNMDWCNETYHFTTEPWQTASIIVIHRINWLPVIGFPLALGVCLFIYYRKKTYRRK